MERQMALLETDTPVRPTARRRANARWQLDDRTREVGRRGLAAAREALAEAKRHHAA